MRARHDEIDVPHDRILRYALKDEQPTFVRGDGIEIVTADGTRLLDSASGVGVSCLGYDVPSIANAMAEQARTLQFVHGMRFRSPVTDELGQRVKAIAPANLEYFFFVSGGSEATESAIKLARQYWLERGRRDKWRVIGRWPGFHGNSLAALAAGWHAERRARVSPLLLEFSHVEAPNTYQGCGHCRLRGTGCDLRCADELERTIIREGPDSVAAFIAEPVVGAAGGAHVPSPEYFLRIREICDRYDVLFIADEVITGFGRTGRWFGVEHFGVEPDVMIFAKGISAGFAPLGGVGVTEEIREAFRSGSGRFEHNFTMAGHPVACAAGVAAVDALVAMDAPVLVAERSADFFSAMEPLKEHAMVGDVRGLGLLAGIELVADRETKSPFPREAEVGARLSQLCMEEGLIVYPAGGVLDGVGDYLLMMPAFVTTIEQYEEIGRRLNAAVCRLEPILVREGVLAPPQ